MEWATQIANGLAAAHERGIVHRDLKPENIFVTRDGVVKILDSGLAVSRSTVLGPDAPTLAGRTLPGSVVGTLGYLSPEQARGGETDPHSNIFSFGPFVGGQAFCCWFPRTNSTTRIVFPLKPPRNHELDAPLSLG